MWDGKWQTNDLKLIPDSGSANAAALFDVVKSWVGKRNGSSERQEPIYIVTTSLPKFWETVHLFKSKRDTN